MAKKKQTPPQEAERNYPRLQVQFDMGYEGTYNPVSTGESQTIPDLNLTVRQLLNNHSRGLSNDRHAKDPIYFDFKIPQVKDLTDIAKFKEYLEEQIDNVNLFIKEEQELSQAEKQQKADAIDDAINKQKTTPKAGEQLEIPD